MIDEIVSVVLNTSMTNKGRFRHLGTDLAFLAADAAVIIAAMALLTNKNNTKNEKFQGEVHAAIDTMVGISKGLIEIDKTTRDKMLKVLEGETNTMPTLHAFLMREKIRVLATPKN